MCIFFILSYISLVVEALTQKVEMSRVFMYVQELWEESKYDERC